MLEVNKKAALKFGIDTDLIENKTNTQENIRILGDDLTFINVREFERTKHVHRLHPYLGKFTPQLVEVFLKKYFKKGDTIIDPFAGCGTTLLACKEFRYKAGGLDIFPYAIFALR